MSEILPGLHFGIFRPEVCERSRLSLPRMEENRLFLSHCVNCFKCCYDLTDVSIGWTLSFDCILSK